MLGTFHLFFQLSSTKYLNLDIFDSTWHQKLKTKKLNNVTKLNLCFHFSHLYHNSLKRAVVFTSCTSVNKIILERLLACLLFYKVTFCFYYKL